MTRKKTPSNRTRRPQYSKRELRSQLAALKKAGAIDKRVNAARVKLTSYRKKQISALRPILTGQMDFVKLPKAEHDAYARTTATRKFGTLLLVPKDRPDQITDTVTRGGRKLVRIRTPLKRGEISEIILPYDAKDLIELATAIQNDEELPDELLENNPLDQYAFSLFGHTVKIGFPTKQELVDYILVNYKHLFTQGNSGDAVKHFSLVNYGGGLGQPPEIPESIAGEKYQSVVGYGKRPNAKGRNDWYNKRQYLSKIERKRKARQSRAKNDPAWHEKEKAAARARAKQAHDRKKQSEFNKAKFDA